MLETAREDQKRAIKGMKSDRWEDGVDDLALGPQLNNGLFPVVSRVRGPVAYELGEQVGVRSDKPKESPGVLKSLFVSPGKAMSNFKDEFVAEKLPKDPKAAVERLRSLWGPGFYPTYDESTDKVVILQGARIKDDAEVAAKKLAENEAQDQAARADQELRFQAQFDIGRARERAEGRSGPVADAGSPSLPTTSTGTDATPRACNRAARRAIRLGIKRTKKTSRNTSFSADGETRGSAWPPMLGAGTRPRGGTQQSGRGTLRFPRFAR